MRVGGAENGDYNYAHAQRFVRERVGHSSAESAHPHTHTHTGRLWCLGSCAEIRRQVIIMALRPLPSVVLVVTFLFGYANGEFLLDPTPPWIVITVSYLG